MPESFSLHVPGPTRAWKVISEEKKIKRKEGKRARCGWAEREKGTFLRQGIGKVCERRCASIEEFDKVMFHLAMSFHLINVCDCYAATYRMNLPHSIENFML